MYLLIRVQNAEFAAGLQAYLIETKHKVVLQSQEDQYQEQADAEFLSLSLAEALGLSPSLEHFKIIITSLPSKVTWLPAPLVITGMVLDREYSDLDELSLLIRHIWKEVTVYNESCSKKIESIGFHQDFLNVKKLPIESIVTAILTSTR